MPTYRAAYWLSADKQSSLRLTTEDQSALPDNELLDMAQREAADNGLEIGDGEIVIDEWRD